jgi:hypothetical protein
MNEKAGFGQHPADSCPAWGKVAEKGSELEGQSSLQHHNLVTPSSRFGDSWRSVETARTGSQGKPAGHPHACVPPRFNSLNTLDSIQIL